MRGPFDHIPRDEKPPAAWTPLLGAAACAFGAALALRRLAYRCGVLSSRCVSVPVMSVGNLRVGGGGKTPFTRLLLGLLEARGLKAAVVSRGYGRQKTRDMSPVIVARGDGPLVDVATAGDEPYLMASTSRAFVAVDADRVAAAQAMVELGVDVILLDDGFQNWRLARDLDIVLLPASSMEASPESRHASISGHALADADADADADDVARSRSASASGAASGPASGSASGAASGSRSASPSASGVWAPAPSDHLLPLGSLREPIQALERADLIVVNHMPARPHFDQIELPASFSSPASAKSIPRIDVVTAPVGFAVVGPPDPSMSPRRTHALSQIEGRRVALFSAIARPGAFETMMTSLGATVVLHRALPDHAWPSCEILEAFKREGRAAGATHFVTTEKDAVKFPEAFLRAQRNDLAACARGNFWCLEIEQRVVSGLARLNAAIDRALEAATP
ncbi:MAG: tetraacyldisaccharide 4'-kinase [Deltaproteobacteria bacterium]|nr:tetraacyldisaccharide 4'-kinase [Deltaproteobacteria bacterium]